MNTTLDVEAEDRYKLTPNSSPLFGSLTPNVSSVFNLNFSCKWALRPDG